MASGPRAGGHGALPPAPGAAGTGITVRGPARCETESTPRARASKASRISRASASTRISSPRANWASAWIRWRSGSGCVGVAGANRVFGWARERSRSHSPMRAYRLAGGAARSCRSRSARSP
uniref:Uncharacterized protein n=1 Tax=Human herpesvirus 2 TaxID=10310 RepID=A0A481TKQ4_HHV2|nr:hypothetical protein [Human alphaherpesvirus 2]QBH82114.1 hypothetical protein [Human alphaherpesvirus 2]